MHATIRRYEGVDAARTNEVSGKVKETLVPQLRELPGFAGYYLIEADNGILSSLGLFETSEQADASTKLVEKWITDENFTSAIPNAPKITSGKCRCAQQRRHRLRSHDPRPLDREGPAVAGPSLVLRRAAPSSATLSSISRSTSPRSTLQFVIPYAQR